MFELAKFPGLDKLSANERQTFVTILLKSGYDPNGVGAVIQVESGWSTSIHGPKVFSQAPGYPIGLIQFAPSTAESLGTSTAELERMSFAEQMRYVVKYYDRYGPSAFVGPGDYYLAGWGANPRTSDDTLLASEGEAAYAGNKGLDRNKDGRIYASELRDLIHGVIANAKSRGVWQVQPGATSGSPTGVFVVLGLVALATGVLLVATRRKR